MMISLSVLGGYTWILERNRLRVPRKKSARSYGEIIAQAKQPAAKTARKRTTGKGGGANDDAAESPVIPSRNRQGGKSSNPDYIQANVYIRKTTKRKVQIALLSKFPEIDMSDLAEQLFSEWLRTNG
jgi:hypothetical protein